MAGVLQGMGKISVAVLSLTAGFVVKCAVTYVLTAVPDLNIDGAAAGSVFGFITVAVISMTAVMRLTKIRFDFTLSVVKPLIAGIIMSIFVLASFRGLSLLISVRLATVIAICVGIAVYGAALLMIKAVTREEIAMLRKARR